MKICSSRLNENFETRPRENLSIFCNTTNTREKICVTLFSTWEFEPNLSLRKILCYLFIIRPQTVPALAILFKEHQETARTLNNT